MSSAVDPVTVCPEHIFFNPLADSPPGYINVSGCSLDLLEQQEHDHLRI